MLRRLFAELKTIEERKNFKIYKIPNNRHKQDFIKTEEWKNKPEPISPSRAPYVFQKPILGTKKYYWCSCGLSTKQPFCDSSHMKTAFKPLDFVIQENVSQVYLCMCKKTKNPPYCDFQTCGFNSKHIE